MFLQTKYVISIYQDSGKNKNKFFTLFGCGRLNVLLDNLRSPESPGCPIANSHRPSSVTNVFLREKNYHTNLDQIWFERRQDDVNFTTGTSF